MTGFTDMRRRGVVQRLLALGAAVGGVAVEFLGPQAVFVIDSATLGG